MAHLLRFMLYADPSRQQATQLGTDIHLAPDQQPTFAYGDVYRLGDEETDPQTWPCYVIAELMVLRQIPDPKDATQTVVLEEVFVAHQHQWHLFGQPDAWQHTRPLPSALY